MLEVAIVTMKLLMPVLVINTPFKRPHTAPSPRPTATAMPMGVCQTSIIPPLMTTHKPAILPTDRFICPTASTTSCERATSRVIATSRSTTHML